MACRASGARGRGSCSRVDEACGPHSIPGEQDVLAASVTGVDPVSLIVAFTFGALSFLSPCVLPLIPGYLSLMSGYSATDLADGNVSVRRMLRVTILFVLGFTAVFVALGAGATSFGSFLLRNQSVATRITGWLIVFMGVFIAFSAVWNPKFLMPLMRERRLEVRPSQLGDWAPPVMGVAFGFGWTPCIGPVLAAIFTIAATQDTVYQGMVLLFVYSLGLGIPFLLTSLVMTKAFGAFAWFRNHLRTINVVSGLLLAFFGVLMITGRLTQISSWFIEFLESIGLDSLSAI
jgi:cytochrome c-type biogenesis protein